MDESRRYETMQVVSQDGTTIGCRTLGRGPGLILLHGGMKAAQHHMALAELLSDTYTVYVVDRRGRGLSGPVRERYGVAAEAEDLGAVVTATGARRVFGLSSGALIALHAAERGMPLDEIVLYEPPLLIDDSVSLDWVERYLHELGQGRLIPALVTALKGTQADPGLARIPRVVLVPFISILLTLIDKPKGDDVSIRSLIPTQRYDMQIIREMAGTLAAYDTLQARTLLIGGTKSPDYLRAALDALADTVPDNRRVTLPGLGHDGPEDDGQPKTVADEMRGFLTTG